MRLPRQVAQSSKFAVVAALFAAACSSAQSSDDSAFSGSGVDGGGDSTTSTSSGAAGDSGHDAKSGSGGSSGSSSGGSSGGGSSSGSSSGGSSSGGSSSSGSSSGGASGDGAAADAPSTTVVCTNTDDTIVTIDATGAIYPQCNTWAIQGSWYCYADGIGTSDCVQGAAPYSAADAAMCVSGTTSTGSTAYGAGLGFGLNSTLGAASVKSAIADSAIIGFEITLSGGTYGSGGSVLNVNMTTAAAAGTYPAVTIPGVAPNSTVTYDVFIKDALEPFVANSPTAQPGGLYDLQVAIPAGAGVQYDYCVTKVKPITATVAPAGGCGSTVAYGPPFCNKPQEYLEEVGAFGVQNDTFASSSGQMCLQAMRGGASCGGFEATFNGFSSTQQYTPGAYPSLVYGWQAGNFYGGYAGGKTVGALTTATTDWSFTVNNVSQYDAAYDIWFSPSKAPANANGGVELMIWLQSAGGVNPADYPAGSVGTVTSGGKSFAAHKTTINNAGSSWTYLAYLAQTQTTSVSALDLKPFFADAEGRGLGSGWYLLGIQAGFEVYNASGSVTTTSFDVNVQ
jgi:hypothetical protein